MSFNYKILKEHRTALGWDKRSTCFKNCISHCMDQNLGVFQIASTIFITSEVVRERGGFKMQTDYIVNLNDLDSTGIIECPYCGKGKTNIYGATGMQSSGCSVCKRIVLWDFDRKTAYKASTKGFVSS